jgi:pseudouridine-5'-phosphate glycosidase
VLQVAPEVAAALQAGRPVVALETTLVTHGFPPAEGMAVALDIEDAVRGAGALPATIGVLGGDLRVGLTREQIERLAATPGVAKLNLSNLSAVAGAGGTGSTTVAATLLVAWRAGIRVLATGGIGGAHRDAARTGDVSGDLAALARYPVAVVCAGAKAVLDLPRTLETLEALGVPVLGLGTEHFPAFYWRHSGLAVDASFADVGGLARAVRHHLALEGGTGVVVANPVPAEHELPREIGEPALERALSEAAAQGVRGRDVTPFLLERVRELTGGRSVVANRALLLDNARVAGRLASALAAAPRS